MKFKDKTINQLKNELEAAEINFRNIEWVAKEWRSLFDSITDFVSLHDKDFRIVRANKALADYVGVKPVELIGKKCHEIFHCLHKPIMDCPHLETMKLKKTATKEFYEPKFGLHLMIVTSPVFDENGGIKGSLHIAKNITERKKAEKKLEEERQKVHKLESIGILADGIAHDFNNILAGILNNVYLSKMHIDRESKEYKRLESAEKAITRATNLTKQLLTFSSGGTPIKKTSSIIEIIRESAEFALNGSNVKCEYIIADDLWPVEIDEGQMNQVIHNLILNADQSMPEGGTIRICAENFDLSSGTDLPLKDRKYLKIVIQDKGIGIEKEHLQNIFDPYFTTKAMGRGLGLSITYSIIKQHDGLITAESVLGVGTTVTIYLPASEKQVEEQKVAVDALIAGEGKILLMDDEEIIRESFGEFLTMKGFEVELAKNGKEAIELYEKAIKASVPFDAVILDLTIRGGMGGKEVVKKLLEIDPDVKTIVSSGYSNNPVMANYNEYGFSTVFCKASNGPDDLCQILNQVIKE